MSTFLGPGQNDTGGGNIFQIEQAGIVWTAQVGGWPTGGLLLPSASKGPTNASMFFTNSPLGGQLYTEGRN